MLLQSAGAVAAARAGADIIAPSDMMDGRIGAIRDYLNAHQFQHIPILSYAAKFSSSYYGPYREAIGTLGLLQGNKKSYYLNPANAEEALREAEQDIIEGADMIMIKPAGHYADIIWRIKQKTQRPILGYQVSGEYTMIKLAASHAGLNEGQLILESLISLKRAGCCAIFTYFAKDAAAILQKG